MAEHPYLTEVRQFMGAESPGASEASPSRPGVVPCLHADILERLTGAAPPLDPCPGLFDDNGLLRLETLTLLIPSGELLPTFSSYSPHVLVLRGLAVAVHQALFSQSDSYEKWLDSQEPVFSLSAHKGSIKGILSRHKEKDSVAACLVFLHLSAVFDRSLGDCFHRQCGGKLPVPHLLREVLASPEVSGACHSGLLHWLRVLMGTPLAINMRNLLWHGFLGAEEFEPHYTSLLVALFATFLATERLPTEAATDISVRPTVDFRSLGLGLHSCLPTLEESLSSGCSSYFVVPGREATMRAALHEFYRGSPLLAVILFLPLIEQGLRRFFIIANQLPPALLLAQYAIVYRTLDLILSVWVEDPEATARHIESPAEGSLMLRSGAAGASRLGAAPQKNQLVQLVGSEIMHPLWDLFQHGFGLRLRNRLAHGEVLEQHLPADVAGDVVAVFLALCDRFAFPKPRALNDAFRRDRYVPRYHPRVLLLRSIVRACQEWRSLRDLSAGAATCELEPPAIALSAEVTEYVCRFDSKQYSYAKAKAPAEPPSPILKPFLLAFADPKLRKQLSLGVPPKAAFDHPAVFEFIQNFAKCERTADIETMWCHKTSSRSAEASADTEVLELMLDATGRFEPDTGEMTEAARLRVFSILENTRLFLDELSEACSALREQHTSLLAMITSRQARTAHRKLFGAFLKLAPSLVWAFFCVLQCTEEALHAIPIEGFDEASHVLALQCAAERLTLLQRVKGNIKEGAIGNAVQMTLAFFCSSHFAATWKRLI